MASPAAFEFLPLGAIIQTFNVGKTNIVQGFPTAELYQKHNSPFFGETIGRVANRIKGAKLDSLNGKSYALAANNGPNSLHGGDIGWGKREWAGPTPVGQREIPGLEGGKFTGGESVKFTLKSHDGEEGFPGDLEVSVIYTAGTQLTPEGKEVNVLAMEYQAELVGGADETVINMTNHSYFNLSGEPTIAGTDVELSTNLYLPVDEHGIPTGGPTVYDAADLSKATLGVTEPDVDDCFVVDEPPNSIPIDTRDQALRKLVAAYHSRTKIHLEVLSTEPAFQFYTGKYIDVPSVEGLPARGARSGFCVEPSRFVNAINVDEWKGQVLLKKGEVYGSRTVYRGWSDE
ncbi:hypothetical protein VF21_02090 [Pseudogymnoascus sp. 05NY08]|nr:hypothetical protein VF21_01982 [Pseudogymnoascus sp. 05NY08]OBT79457.1 hypothetical protein VF21_02090 [Pseudogymnoascus sp. 05NY08]